MNAKSSADPMQVHTATLANGLKIYLSENHEQPRIAARVVVRAGAAEDPRTCTGIAHYLEHMLANKGSQRLGTHDYAAEAALLDQIRELYEQLRAVPDGPAALAIYQQIDALGLAASAYAVPNELKQLYGLLGARSLNASTSHDQTTYVVDIPAGRLAHWAALEGDRFRWPVFRAFQTEVETVFEEKNRSLDDPGRRIGATLRAALWGDHPYGGEILGESAHLRRPSVAEMERFFGTWYVPNNMAVVLAGDLDPDEAFALIERHFGELAARPLPERARPPLADLPAEGLRRTLYHPGLEEVQLAWRTVPYGDPRRPTAEVADMVLDNRATGLLNRHLNIPQRVRRAGSYTHLMREGGAQVLWGRPRGGQTVAEVEALLRAQIDRLRGGEVEQADLDAIVLDYSLAFARSLEDNASRAGLLMRCFQHDRPWEGVEAELDRLRGVTIEQIAAFAEAFLTGPGVVVARCAGEAERPSPLAPPITGRRMEPRGHSAFFGEILALPAAEVDLRPLEEGVHYQRRTDAGLSLITAPNPHNALFQLSLHVATGRDGDLLWGGALALWLRGGAGPRTLEDLARDLYRLGVDMGASSGRRTTTLRLEGPDAALEAALDLLRARLTAPNLAADQIARFVADAVAQRQQAREDRGVITKAAQELALYGVAESSFLGRAPSDADLQRLSADAVRTRVSPLAVWAREAHYVGPRDPDAVLALLDRPHAAAPRDDLSSQHYAAFSDSEVWVVHHPAVQASISVLSPQPPYDPEQAHLYHVFNEYMGGSAGVVFQEIREARGMAYAAQASLGLGWQRGDDNLLWASVGTQADKAAEVSALLLSLLRQPPLDDARLARAREGAVEKLRTARVSFRGIPGSIMGWLRRGYAGDPRPDRLRRLQALSLDDLAAFTQPLAQAPMRLVVVGDAERMDLDGLRQVAPLRQLSPAELFGY